MILRASLAASHLVMFETGSPDADITWSVLDSDGATLSTGTITPAAEDVSALIPISSADTTLAGGQLQSHIDVVWTYDVSGAVTNGESRFIVEARLGLGISAKGVRTKLGVSSSELPDSEIGLVESYLRFRNFVGETDMDAALDGGLATIDIRNAVEAASALALLPTMPVRISNSESSGTNEFKRQEVDWMKIHDELETFIVAGYTAVDPNYDVTEGYGNLLLLATPSSDPITGA